MRLDGLCTARAGPEPSGGVPAKHLGDDVAGVRGELVREDEIGIHDLAIHQIGVVRVECREPREHLEEEHAEGPPVDGFVVAVALENLWRKILGGSAERPRGLALAHALFAEPKVCDAHVAFVRDQNVLGLEIAVHNVEAVEVLERARQLGSVELTALGREADFLLEMEEQLAAVDVVEDEIQLGVALERELEADNERVVDAPKDPLLCARVLDLVALDDGVLGEHLHGVETPCVFLRDEHHLAERAFAQNLEQIKALDRELVRAPLARLVAHDQMQRARDLVFPLLGHELEPLVVRTRRRERVHPHLDVSQELFRRLVRNLDLELGRRARDIELEFRSPHRRRRVVRRRRFHLLLFERNLGVRLPVAGLELLGLENSQR
eukprot:Amastigsp_a175486_287.p2 type:complete len:380 gc:universal Amastigsp_a175486_287:226-1365(+)